MFKCQRCGYETHVKSNFKLHIFKKNPCAARESLKSIDDIRKEYEEAYATKEKSIACQFCKKGFTCRQSKYAHLKICKVKQAEDAKQYIAISTHEDIIAVVENYLAQRNGGSPSHSTIQQANVINNNNVQNNVQNNLTVNITLRDFEDETNLASHLSDEFKIGCLIEKNIPKLIKAIYCNDERPDNMCIRLKNKKEKLFQVVKDGEWVSMNGSEALKELIDNGYRVLNNFWFFEDKRDEVDRVLDENDCYDQVRAWMNKLKHDDPKVYKDLKDKTFLIFVDQKGQATLLSRDGNL